MQNEKKCSKCHTTKLLSFFSGTQSRCKSCRAEIRRERYQNNRLQELAWTRKSRGITDPKILAEFELPKKAEQPDKERDERRRKEAEKSKTRYATDPEYRERVKKNQRAARIRLLERLKNAT